MIRSSETLQRREHLNSEIQFGVSQALLADGGLTTSRPTLLDPLGTWPKQSADAPRDIISRGLPAAPRPWTLELLPYLGG